MIRLWYNCVALEDNDRLDAHLHPLDLAQLLAFLSKTDRILQRAVLLL